MTVLVSKPALNVREELSALKKPSGVAGAAMLAADTVAEQQALLGVGRRNLLINGDFQVSQRGDYSSATTISNDGYYLDRWQNNASAATAQVSRQEVVLPNGRKTYSIKLTATSSATAYLSIHQIIENWQLLSGSTITMSAWIRTNRSNVGFRRSGDTDFGDKAPSDGQWHFVTGTYKLGAITAAGASGTGFSVVAYNNAAVSIVSGDYVEAAEVQLELGKVATPFEHRSYGEELALCQRYYESSNTSGAITYSNVSYYNASTGYMGYRWKVQKRTTPTVTVAQTNWNLYDTPGIRNVTSVTTDGIGLNDVAIVFHDTGNGYTAGNAGFVRNLAANAITVDAEL